jgi:DNA-nicking Smr family endonuclease
VAKKKETPKPPAPPKFGGFHPLAGGLEGFKAKLDAEAKSKGSHNAGAKGRPPATPPAVAAPHRAEPVRDRTSDLDDQMSFHRMMSGVTPLDTGKKQRIPVGSSELPSTSPRTKAEDAKTRAAAEAEAALAHLHSIVDDDARFEVFDDGKRVEGRRAGVTHDLVRQLRRGQLPIDGRLDLHGLGARAAETALVDFLRLMRTRNERCVLVIHGKGERIPGAGVLRGEISTWLSQGKAREHVAAFATSRDDDGGEGAVYVALRR